MINLEMIIEESKIKNFNKIKKFLMEKNITLKKLNQTLIIT